MNELFVDLVGKLCGKNHANITHKYGDINSINCKIFKNHQSIKKIEKNLRGSARTEQNKTNKFISWDHVEKLLTKRDPKISMVINKIPTKLV